MTSRHPDLARLAAVAALVALGTWLRAAHLGGPDFGFDEFYHVLAARSLLGGEGLEVAEGRPYGRAGLVTVLTAAAFALAGESEAAARLPALASGVATLPVVFLTGRRLFGPTGGLATLALAALSPDLIDASRFARLYSPLVLAYLIAAMAVFRALETGLGDLPRPRAAAGWLLAGTVAFAAALHLHSAALGLAASVLADVTVLAGGLALAGRGRAAAPHAALSALLVLAGAAALLVPPVRQALCETALTPLDWYVDDEGPLAYHYYLIGQYGWLWYLVWPATVAAVVARPREGLFTATAFWVPFVAISAGVATRAPRYVAHLLPFAWLLLGGAAGLFLDAARDALARRLAHRLPGTSRGRRAAREAVALGLIAAAILPPLALSRSVAEALARPSRRVGAFATGHFAGWRAAAPAVQARLGTGDIVVSSVPLASRYYFGRPAVRLLGPGRPRAPWKDARRDIVQTAADLAAVRSRRAGVVVVLEAWRWEAPDKLGPDLRSALAEACRPIALPSSTALVAFDCAPRRR